MRPGPIPIGWAWPEPASQNGVAANKDATRTFGTNFILTSPCLAGALHSASMFQKRGNAANMDHVGSVASANVQLRDFTPRELAFLKIVNCPLLIQIKSFGRSRIEGRANGIGATRPEGGDGRVGAEN